MRDLFAAGRRTSCRSTSRGCSRAPRRRASSRCRRSNRALADLPGTTALHTCFGYAGSRATTSRTATRSWPSSPTARPTCSRSRRPSRGLDPATLEPIAHKTVIVGVLDLSTTPAETPEQVASGSRRRSGRSRRAAAGRPDCGMKYLPRELAFAKLRALVEGARLVRERIA
jgi:5-methyltetrahydropteroyltriglutamate--homocysteine methyltransferase